jgi:D-beta-D-heptose 7-phosphate kinase/D-beta-D-heptose 1-phosphate adenosyltransferase
LITNIEDFLEIRKKIKEKNQNIIFTNGCFDIIHRGHIEYLNEAKSLGDILIVGLNSDYSVRILKGEKRPVNKELDRAAVLDNIKSVDYVIIFGEETPYELIKKVIPDILVKGGDWKESEIVGADIVKNNGGVVKSLKYVKNYSTTEILKKICSL